MSAGANAAITKGVLDFEANRKIVALKKALEEVSAMHRFLLNFTTEQLQADPWNYTADDAANLKNSFAALNQLNLVATAQATVANVDDFFFFGKKITGFNL